MDANRPNGVNLSPSRHCKGQGRLMLSARDFESTHAGVGSPTAGLLSGLTFATQDLR